MADHNSPEKTNPPDGNETVFSTPSSVIDSEQNGEGAPSASVSKDGISIPGYEVLEELGRGGMGVVYKARQVQLNRLVALKMVLAGGHASESDVARFLQEAEAVAALQHPNIVQVYDSGAHNNLPYMALEFVEGGSLDDLLQGAPLAPTEAAQLIAQMAKGMQVAHEKGIVHRDLKPGNVLLASSSQSSSSSDSALVRSGEETTRALIPRITDFGLAKRVESGTNLTQTGAIMGTPSYMAPEQAQGNGRQIGPSADIYALGAILYECLTGRPPFRAANPLDTILQVVQEEPVAPSHLQPGLPRDLETICLKCLRKEPHRRYASAEELAQDLQRFLDDKPVMARRSHWTERAWRWCRRNPLVAGMVATVAVLLLTITIGSVVAAILLNQERLTAQRARSQAQQAQSISIEAEREKTEQLWESYLDQAQAGRWSGRAGRRFASLDALRKAAEIRPTLELRNEAIACMPLVDVEKLKEWKREENWTSAVSFDARFEHYAQLHRSGMARICRTADDRVVQTIPGLDLGAHPGARCHLSPNGGFLAIRANNNGKYTFLLWNLKEKKVLARWPETTRSAAMAFSPDSKWFAVNHRPQGIRIYRLDKGKVDHELVAPSHLTQIRFSSRGDRLAIASSSTKEVQIWNRERKGMDRSLQHTRRGHISSVAWSADDTQLAAGFNSGIIYLWYFPLNGRPTYRQLTGHTNLVSSLHFSHEGGVLSSSSWDGSARFWAIQGGKELLKVEGALGPFREDDRRIVYRVGDLRFGIYRVATGQECRLFELPSGIEREYARGISFSPDGRLLAIAGVNGCRIVDLPHGRDFAFLPTDVVQSVAWLPQGKSLLTSGNAGVRLWPLHKEEKRGILRLGPAKRLRPFEGERGGTGQGAMAQGKLLLAISRNNKAEIVDLRHPEKKMVIGSHSGLTNLSISPNGEWLATGTWQGKDLHVWSVKEKKTVHTVPGQSMLAKFSPNGKWLVTGSATEFQFLETGTWKVRHRVPRNHEGQIPGPIAFSPDSKWTAVAWSYRLIRIVETETGRELATLQPEHPERLTDLAFSPNGYQLAAATREVIQLWDLRRIQEQLREMKLDWDPSGSPSDQPQPTLEPLVAKIDLGGNLDELQSTSVFIPLSKKEEHPGPALVEKWIGELSSTNPKARESARSSLKSCGPDAIPLLQKAVSDNRLKHETAEPILDAIQLRAVLDPRYISLELEDASISDALRALQKLSKTRIHYSGSKAEPRRITLKLDKVPFWDALHRICKQGGLDASPSRSSGQKVIVAPSKEGAPIYIATNGPFRAQLESLHRSIQLPIRSSSKLPTTSTFFRLALLHHSREPLGYGGIQIHRLIDSQGRNIPVPGPTQPSGYRPLEPLRSQGYSYSTLRVPKGTKGLKTIEVRMALEVPLKQKELARAPIPQKRAAVMTQGANGISMMVTGVSSRTTSTLTQLRATVVIGSSADWSHDRAHHHLLFVDAEGNRYPLSSAPIFRKKLLQKPLPEHIALIGGVAPQSGMVAMIPWLPLNQTLEQRQRAQSMASITLYHPKHARKPLFLVLDQVKRAQTELPIVLRDIPFP